MLMTSSDIMTVTSDSSTVDCLLSESDSHGSSRSKQALWALNKVNIQLLVVSAADASMMLFNIPSSRYSGEFFYPYNLTSAPGIGSGEGKLGLREEHM